MHIFVTELMLKIWRHCDIFLLLCMCACVDDTMCGQKCGKRTQTKHFHSKFNTKTFVNIKRNMLPSPLRSSFRIVKMYGIYSINRLRSEVTHINWNFVSLWAYVTIATFSYEFDVNNSQKKTATRTQLSV